MKSNVWSKLVLWTALILLLFLNFYTLIHAVSGWIIGIVIFLFLLFAHQYLSSKEEAFLNRTALSLGVLIVTIQIVFVILLHSNIRYDAFWILDQAVEMLDTHKISPELSNAYFSQVPNNYGLTIITYWFLSIIKALGFSSGCFMTAVQLFNIVFIDLSVLFIYLIIRKAKGAALSLFFLLFCAISPYLYVWTPYYYTSTTSMMFACAALWLWQCICHSSSMKRQCILTGIMGILCITGFKVRATSLIPYIAILLYWSVHYKKGRLKKYVPSILVFIVSVLISFVSWKGIVSHYAPFDTRDTALPITHFIMLGTHDPDGSFHMDDLRYTISLPTKKDKVEGTTSVILKRLSENGLWGNIKLLLNKQLNCWADGTDSFTTEHTHCTDFNKLHTYIIGSKSGFLAAYAQTFRALQLFLVCVSCIAALTQKRIDITFLLALNLLGGMVFHLLWEAGPFYSLAFTLFSYALAIDGINQLDTFRLFKTKWASILPFSSSLLCLFFSSLYLLSHWHTYTQEPQLMTDFVATQHMETSGEDGPAMEIGQIWAQTFEAEIPFNVLNLYYFSPMQEGSRAIYHLILSDEHGSVFYDDMIYGNNTGYELYYEIQFEPIIPSGRTVYTISIEPLVQDSKSYLHFGSQDTSRVDLYPYGTLTIDGVPTGRDLCFRVLSRHIGTYASKKEYSLFAILLLTLELFLVFKSFGLVHQKRRSVSRGV